MNEEDKELTRRFLADRDEEIFRQIYRRHTPRLYLLALRLTGAVQADADDAVQEMWIRAVRKLGEFRWESKLSTWLSGILIRCCQEVIAKRKLLQIQISDNLEAPFSANNTDLERLIRALPDGCRQVLILHDIEGFTHEEIAERLGIASGTSKSQLSHARKILRMKLTH